MPRSISRTCSRRLQKAPAFTVLPPRAGNRYLLTADPFLYEYPVSSMQQQVDPVILQGQVFRSLVFLCRQYGVRELALFGSATGEKFDPETSDIDFLITFEPMPPTEHMRRYFGLLEDLETLFQRKVDLVEQASIENPFVLASILKGKVDLYAAA